MNKFQTADFQVFGGKTICLDHRYEQVRMVRNEKTRGGWNEFVYYYIARCKNCGERK